MKKIKFFSSYCSEQQILDNITNAWGIINGKYKDLEFVIDNSYTHAVVFNTAFPTKNLPKENVVGFSHEPRMILQPSKHFIDVSKSKIGTYFIDDIFELPNNFKLGNSYVCPHELVKSKGKFFSHERKISFHTSLKMMTPGHIYRQELVKEILKTDMDIHIYSQGLASVIKDERVIKNFDYNNWGENVGLTHEKYKYHIVIENVINNTWMTEKFTNCLIKGTIPIYLGSKSVNERYGDCCINLTGNIENDINIIYDVYYNEPKINLKEAVDKFYEDNFLEFLFKYFQ